MSVSALRLATLVPHSDALYRFLSDRESARAARYTDAEARHAFVATRAALRGLLAVRLGMAPRHVPLAEDGNGKPVLARAGTDRGAAGRLDFNVSHSGGLALIALSDGGPVGVDVEAIAAIDDLDAVAERIWYPGELAAWRALPAALRLPAFYRAWTCKEACAKAIGGGLALDLRGAADGWAVYSLDVGTAHAAALACAPAAAAPAPLRWLAVHDLLGTG